MRRVLAIVNKWWECEPVLATLLNPNATKGLPWPLLAPVMPTPAPQSPAPAALPRAIFTFKNTSAEVWCISDLLMQTTTARQSSTEDKAKFLPQITAYGSAPDLVISVGTASSPTPDTSINGCVVVGTKGFLHDGHPASNPNPDSAWRGGNFDILIDSRFPEDAFAAVFSAVPAAVEASFAPVRNFSADPPRLMASYDYTALATVNITNSADYATADPATVATFDALKSEAVAGSVDTTHAVVRSVIDAPFMFISAIVNRLTMIGTDTLPNFFPQTTAGCMNSGVTLGWLLSRIDDL
jgi:hypothetical protein